MNVRAITIDMPVVMQLLKLRPNLSQPILDLELGLDCGE
jgi:hypothetical protein